MSVEDKLKGPFCKIYNNLLPEIMGMFNVVKYNNYI